MNHLYPVFLKLSNLKILIVGAGEVCSEKLHFILKSSPDANITILAPEIKINQSDWIEKYPYARIKFLKKTFDARDIKGHHLVIATTDKPEVNEYVFQIARNNRILVNVADNPPFCDFYMGSIVNKGNVKVAISTNGKSPTLAKRLRQFFEYFLPDEIDDLASNLNNYRETLSAFDFKEKVKLLNRTTAKLVT